MPKGEFNKTHVSGGHSVVKPQPEVSCHKTGPRALGATSREGNTLTPGTVSGSRVVNQGGGHGSGRGGMHASGSRKMPGRQDNRSY
ncbi:MAG: hypothetical protein GY719_10055 [bacterium]|nr:hypothetical protein [bacterium]